MNLDSRHVEYGLIFAIFLILVFIFRGEPEQKSRWDEPKIIQSEFNENPILAWRGEDKGGEVVKIKYRITNQNTKLWVFDIETGEVVHEQPFDRDPKMDGSYRDFTYVWRLYKTERTIDVEPGIYQIVIGGIYQPTSTLGKLSTIIQIDSLTD